MENRTFNVLFIGNSFSECTCAYLYDFLTVLGIPDFHIAALKISGATVDMHWDNAQNDAPAYMFYQYTTSGDRKTVSSSYTLKEGITSCQWDWVVFGDGAAGLANSGCPNLHPFIDYVKGFTTPGKTRFAFNMTWPWELGFHKYSTMFEGSPEIMFRGIISNVRNAVMTLPDITCLIPIGTAVRNALQADQTLSLYRDGYHLNANGCFIASLTTLYALLKQTDGFSHYDISRCGIPCLPTTPHRTNGSFIGTLNAEYSDIFLKSVASALTKPLDPEET